MKICFPARKHDGKPYRDLKEIMDSVRREPHGSWLAGTNCLWHGGIHISDVTAPGSVPIEDNTDSAIPLQCMADGEIVACRVNEDYLTSTYNKQTLQYSSTFVLIKSTCKPDPKQESTWLEFYSLYMGLAPLSAYPKRKIVTALKTVLRHPPGSHDASTSPDGVADIPPGKDYFNAGSRAIILKEAQFRHSGKSQPFGLVKSLNKRGEATGEAFWVTLLPEYMTPSGEHYAALPAWMQHAIAQGEFNSVVSPSVSLSIRAGEAVGFLAKETDPVGTGKTNTRSFAHIEVLSTDSRMPAFLSNPGNVTIGKKYIRLGLHRPLYIKTGETFEKISAITERDGGKVLERDKCHPQTSGGKFWYQIRPYTWMSQDDVDELNQYDLTEREFCALTERSGSDMKKSLHEGWVRDVFSWLAARINADKGMQQAAVSRFYKAMLDRLDTDQDDILSSQEIFHAIHHPEMGVQRIVSRLVVRHDSEWFGGSRHHKWTTWFQNIDVLRLDYVKKWLDDCEWMSQVPPFDKGDPVWHMHPIVFLDAIKTDEYDFSTRESTIEAIVAESKKQGFSLNAQVAYILATVKRETGDTFKPVREGDWIGHTSTEDYRKTHYRYYPYYGRGYVQITWDYNYQAYSEKLGIDLVTDPDKALDPYIAMLILIDGFKNGVFTGKKLIDYVNDINIDFYQARRCINGLDHAEQIQVFAEEFLSKLDAGEWQ